MPISTPSENSEVTTNGLDNNHDTYEPVVNKEILRVSKYYVFA